MHTKTKRVRKRMRDLNDVAISDFEKHTRHLLRSISKKLGISLEECQSDPLITRYARATLSTNLVCSMYNTMIDIRQREAVAGGA